MTHQHKGEEELTLAQQLIVMYTSFQNHINKVNMRKNEKGRMFEDDVGPTFKNFIEYLHWLESRDLPTN